MGRFILTEEDKKEVMNNYFGEFNQKFYDFLKANITVHSQKMENFSKPFVIFLSSCLSKNSLKPFNSCNHF